ncbi:MAG: tRNA (adenosine(37)-N6)-threonylcarbamoyltransferase complex transferase subunit TsaD [Candidatus Odinarchaeota archaeon]
MMLKIPLIGVNHCIAHIEIGRRSTNTEDPLTLYVSGGNTIVAAFDSGRYRVFGETLDLAIGNLLDSFSRLMGFKHPGGPKIEAYAEKGRVLIDLPYIVKGMDLSYSGLLTAISSMVKKYKIEDLCYSIQETAFAMLAEVTERALAHTEKKDVLLTGGVAANKRLQQMIKIISEEHDANFQVVPREYSGDNGLMIAWTGMLYMKSGKTTPISESHIRPKWRLDEIDIPWR